MPSNQCIGQSLPVYVPITRELIDLFFHFSFFSFFFHCPFGVKRGFILRPVLFSLFVNEIAVANT